MQPNDERLSLLLDQAARPLAEWTVTLHAERDPSLPARYGSRWRSNWVNDVHTRVLLLSQAVALRQPGLFSRHVGWSRAAFEAREIGPDDLRLSLTCLAEVLVAELPSEAEPAAGLVRDVLSGPPGGVGMQAGPPTPAVRADRPHGRLALRYLEALLEGDRRRAEAMIHEAARAGVSVQDLYLCVFAPAMTEVGDMWHMNEITVADEHFAMAATESLMSQLRAYFPAAPRVGRHVVATSISGDQHALGVRMVADFFEMAGWDASCLGASTPAADVLEYLAHREADLLAVSVTNPLYLRSLADLIRGVRSAENLMHIPVLVGGGPFLALPDLWRSVGADGSATSAAGAVELGCRLVGLSR